ncbi:MAG: UbiD family decarboxylase [Deltaproteobacteria bacterium]|nr:MAG: UbiD family decarboxylase [Deltaproteobacteria bacterium]
MGAGYNDLRDHLKKLEEKGLLVRVKREINKDTELHPLVRWQFRGGLAEEDRKAFLFENVVDSRGRKYDIPVVVGAYAASKYVYATGLGYEVDEVASNWERDLAHPMEPELVSDGPVQEVVHTGDELKELGVDQFPVPISTPGFDNAPYITCAMLVTKDPETGIRNVGNYRAQVKDNDRLALNFIGLDEKDAAMHWHKCRERGVPLEAALVIGGSPAMAYASVTRVPYGVDELSIAGGLVHTPIRVVKCKTVDIEVPAEAEIVIEGKIPTDYLEPEGPFGESHGHMDPRTFNPNLEITAITNRKDAIFVSWMSQITPSESSVIKAAGLEATLYRYLKIERRVRSVNKVFMHEPLTNLRRVIFIQMKNPSKDEVWRALYSAITFQPEVGKIIIAVSEDIEPDNLDAVLWSLAYRMRPAEDTAIVKNRTKAHGPPFDMSGKMITEAIDSALLIDATLKEPFPPVSLPKKEYMERAREIWEELGLPPLKPQSPWFGYSLGQWSEELDEEGKLAVKGKYYLTGEKLKQRQVKGNQIDELLKKD